MANSIGNPFESTQPARQYFVGRQKELSQLRGYLNTVKHGGATNLYIVGGGGDGKTSFLYRTLEEATHMGLLAALITVSDEMDPDDVIYQLIESVLDTVATAFERREYYDDFRQGQESASFRVPVSLEQDKKVTPRDLEKDFEFLLHIASEIGAKGIIFCIDEGQRLEHINGGALFAKLRAAIQKVGKGFMIVLAALEDIIPTIAEGYTGIDRFFPNQIGLGPFENTNVAIAAIEKRLEGHDITFPHKVSTSIVNLAERHPKEIVDICHDLYANAITSDDPSVTTSMVKSVIYSRYSENVKQVLKILGGLQPNHLTTLRMLLRLNGNATAMEIAERYCGGGTNTECVRRMEPIAYQDLQFLVSKRICQELAAHGDESQFSITNRLNAYILTNELGVTPGRYLQ